MPDLDGEDATEEGEGHQEKGPPEPGLFGEETDADGLQTAAKVNEPVDNARGSGGGFASAEVGRGGAGHERMDADDGHLSRICS